MGVVAPLKARCIICRAPELVRLAINAAMWDEEGSRTETYCADALRVAHDSRVPELARLKDDTVRRHAEHVEESWQELAPGEAPVIDDRPLPAPVFPHDFESVTTAAARAGARAIARLEEHLDGLDPKETIAVAKLGLNAAGNREALRLKRNQQSIDIAAIFGVVSGMVEIPEHAVRNVTPLEDLRGEVTEERRLLAERAGR